MATKLQEKIQSVMNFFHKKQSQYYDNIIIDKLSKLKMARIASCDSNLVNGFLKKQTAVVTNSDR